MDGSSTYAKEPVSFEVESLAGKGYKIQMCETVRQAKSALLRVLINNRLPYKKIADIRLLFGGRELHDVETLDDCGVQPDSVIFLSIRRLACPCCSSTKADNATTQRRRTTRLSASPSALNPQNTILKLIKPSPESIAAGRAKKRPRESEPELN